VPAFSITDCTALVAFLAAYIPVPIARAGIVSHVVTHKPVAASAHVTPPVQRAPLCTH